MKPELKQLFARWGQEAVARPALPVAQRRKMKERIDAKGH